MNGEIFKPSGMTDEERQEWIHVYDTRIGILVGTGQVTIVEIGLAVAEANDWLERWRQQERASQSGEF